MEDPKEKDRRLKKTQSVQALLAQVQAFLERCSTVIQNTLHVNLCTQGYQLRYLIYSLKDLYTKLLRVAFFFWSLQKQFVKREMVKKITVSRTLYYK